MKLAIKISKKGVGKVNPNPLVGAVIVKDNKIIGQGYHEYYGGNHAEVNAFENLSDNPEGATIYVTLEPCSHYGKTPPCVDKIIDNKISKVVIGTLDPNPLVQGKGVKKLKEAGIDGIVCSAQEVDKIVEACGKDFVTVCPGIRPANASVGDQKRVVTPKDAIDKGAHYLVVGRPITKAENPSEAAVNIVKEIENA